MNRVFAIFLTSCVLLVAESARADFAADAWLTFSKHDVRSIDAPGLPGTLCVFGEDAVVLVAPVDHKIARPLVAAAPFGKGTMIAIGHNGYLSAESKRHGDTQKMFDALIDIAGSPDIRIVSAGDITDDEIAGDEKFVSDGGTIIAAEPGWGWLQLNPGKSLRDLPANKLFAKAGIVFDSGTIEPPSDHLFTLDPQSPPPKYLNASAALQTLSDPKSPDAHAAARALAVAAQSLPPDCDLMKRLAQLRATNSPISNPAMSPVFLAIDVANRLSDHAQTPAPSAKEFPGAVGDDVPRVADKFEFDLAQPGWHGVGLYAPPGAAITLKRLMPTDVPLMVRIGCHSDSLWSLNDWKRPPEIDGVWPVRKDGSTTISNAFGGLIYIVIPENANGRVAFEISGAVRSPRFVLNSTTDEKWRSDRKLAAPWAEIEGEKIILTVPSDVIRNLDNPTDLMKWWDRVADTYADFAGIPHKRLRPERYVTDVEISAGYMHSGYPIMTHLDAAPRFVDLATLSTVGDWGMFHELGHNHQQSDWTFDGTGEVTNNVFALYALDTVCSAGKIHEAMTPNSRARATAKYRSFGTKFTEWKNEPFTALIMYAQLHEAFGWDAYKKMFAEYRSLKPDERPKTDDEKRDQWMVRFSRTVGKNLGPFFEWWGVPTSQAARDSIKDLPKWMPEKE